MQYQNKECQWNGGVKWEASMKVPEWSMLKATACHGGNGFSRALGLGFGCV